MPIHVRASDNKIWCTQNILHNNYDPQTGPIEEATCVHCVCSILARTAVASKYAAATRRLGELQNIITTHLEKGYSLTLSQPAQIAKDVERYRVRVTCMAALKDMDPDDIAANVDGSYLLDVPPGEDILDIIHRSIPMARPEHFNIIYEPA